MEIEVGDYVRTDRGIIAKVDEIRLGTNRERKVFQNIYELDNGLWTVIDYIKKHRKNIIDLVEVGDYVNGRLVLQVDYKNKNVCLLMPLTDTLANTNIMWYGYEDIKTIVTHEQMQSIEYKVEEDK